MADIGPQLPPHLQKKKERQNNVAKKQCYGPVLPPGFQKVKKSEERVIEPALPTSFSQHEDSDDEEEGEGEGEEEEYIIGPCMPMQDDDAGEAERIKQEFESRSKTMKNKIIGKFNEGEKLERENWMLELPPEMSKNFGLGPRTFRSKAPELGDQSVWTDTPADKEKRLNQRREDAMAGKKRKPEIKEKAPSAEEMKMHARVEEYNKATRPKSLLEMHKEKRNKTDEPATRRPFDRDKDLAIHRSNPNERAKFIQHAKGLNNKFSMGSYENKFL